MTINSLVNVISGFQVYRLINGIVVDSTTHDPVQQLLHSFNVVTSKIQALEEIARSNSYNSAVIANQLSWQNTLQTTEDLLRKINT